MIRRFAQKLWGTFESTQECLKFIRLASIFAFTIGVYWILVPTKDVVFLHTVGLDGFPYSKWVSMLLLIPAIMGYSKLMDRYPRHRLFYALCSMYAVGALIFAYIINHQTWGITADIGVHRWIGWLWYAYVESFGSLIVTLFWSFASDISSPEAAKRGFPLIALGAQCGGVFGPLAVYQVAHLYNPAFFILIAALGMLCIIALVVYFMRVTPIDQLAGYHTKNSNQLGKPTPSFSEGISLIFSNRYLLMIVGIVMMYDLVSTTIEYHVKTLARLAFVTVPELNSFLFKFAVCVNGIALLSLIFGIGALGRWLGVVKTLLFLPILVGIGVVLVWYSPTLSMCLLVSMFIKGLNYALGQPTKEQLYIPTSRETKYKAKAWIDTFGSRSAKGFGSGVHALRSVNEVMLPLLSIGFMGVSSIISLFFVGVWLHAAWQAGKIYTKALADDKIIC